MPLEQLCQSTGLGLWIFCIFNLVLNIILFRAFIKYMSTLESAMLEALKTEIHNKELEELHKRLKTGKFLLMLFILLILLSAVCMAEEVGYMPISMLSNGAYYDEDPWLAAILNSNFFNDSGNNSSLWLL